MAGLLFSPDSDPIRDPQRHSKLPGPKPTAQQLHALLLAKLLLDQQRELLGGDSRDLRRRYQRQLHAQKKDNRVHQVQYPPISIFAISFGDCCGDLYIAEN